MTGALIIKGSTIIISGTFYCTKGERKYLFYFSTYDPLTITHLFQRFSNKDVPSKKILLISPQKFIHHFQVFIRRKMASPQVLF
jgi:hypothetical protein